MSADIIKSDVVVTSPTSLAGILEKYSEILTLTSTNRIQLSDKLFVIVIR